MKRKESNPSTNILDNNLNQLDLKSSGPAVEPADLAPIDQDRQRTVISDPALFTVTAEEQEIFSEIVDALRDTNIDQLPEEPRSDTIRGLLWALEELLTPLIEPREQHPAQFNVSLTAEEVLVGRAAKQEIWNICCSLLCGLGFLTTRGRISDNGDEIPATWSPGDLFGAIDEARPRLEGLAAMSDKLCSLRHGELSHQSSGTTGSEIATNPEHTDRDTQDASSNN